MRRWINGDMRKKYLTRKKIEMKNIDRGEDGKEFNKVKSKINTISIVFMYSFSSSFSHLSCFPSIVFIISLLFINKNLGKYMFDPSQTPKYVT